MTCPKCKALMKEGKAIVNGVTGMSDFIGDEPTIQTMSYDPRKVILTDCFKCPECGHSQERK